MSYETAEATTSSKRSSTTQAIAVCDCWRAYDFLSNATLQRYGAHPLRKSAELEETVAGRHFHKKISDLFEQIRKFNNQGRTDKARQQKYNQMTAKLQKIITYYPKYDDCKSVVKYVKNHPLKQVV